MTTASHPDLIERLEQASEPTEALFFECYVACFPGATDTYQFLRFVRVGAWTDAAIMLVPEGHGMLMATGRGCKATVSAGYLGEMETLWTGDATAPSLPLALAIAALKAGAARSQTISDASR